MASSAASAKAADFMKQAEKKLNSWALFNKQGKFDDASELYAKAANQFKVAKDFDEAGRAYELAADNAYKAQNEAESLNYLNNAAKVYKQESPTEAVRVFRLVVEQLKENNKYSQAGKVYKQIGEICEEASDVEGAVNAFKEAAECFQLEDSHTTANQMLLKVADFEAQRGNYADAVGLYQNVASKALESALTKWSVTDYYFRAAICTFVQDATAGTECKSTTGALDNYVDAHPAFANSRENTLMRNLVETFEANDVQAFTDHLFEYNQISTLDQFKSGLLLKIKKAMIERDNDLGEADADEEDVPDFT